MNDNKYFNKALSNFTQDFASGNAIRHLVDLGYTIPEIQKKLDYPTPIGKIKEIVWKYLIDKKTILLEQPSKSVETKVTYVKETDSFGRTSFRRVEERIDILGESFVICDFGKQIYKDKKAFEEKLNVLDENDREYIENMQWPLQRVYYRMDERMSRIAEKMELEIFSMY